MYNYKGGVGMSSLVTNLALALARESAIEAGPPGLEEVSDDDMPALEGAEPSGVAYRCQAGKTAMAVDMLRAAQREGHAVLVADVDTQCRSTNLFAPTRAAEQAPDAGEEGGREAAPAAGA